MSQHLNTFTFHKFTGSLVCLLVFDFCFYRSHDSYLGFDWSGGSFESTERVVCTGGPHTWRWSRQGAQPDPQRTLPRRRSRPAL